MRGMKLPNQSEGRNISEYGHLISQKQISPSELPSSKSLTSSLRPFINNYASKAQINQVQLRFFNMPCLHMCETGQEKPYYPVEEKMKRKLERVHSDLCGQYPESKGNSKYIITFLDDFTHWCWIKSIPNKNSDTIRNAFQDLLKQIENETELKIKYLRTDNGGEYAGDLLPLLKDMGIIPEHGRQSRTPKSNPQ